MTARPQPLLKWAGGKRQLAVTILSRLPERIDTYYEPFVGGGAVFFALAAEGRFRRAVLSDRNPDLVCVYRAVQEDVEAVIEALGTMRHTESEYYRIREQKPRSAARRAARIIYLNKTGYNGLYRVNRAGQFNVPFGRYENPRICDADNLRLVARALENVEISVDDFAASARRARPGDAVYFDPPYLPVSKTASFASYHSEPFGLREHERLAHLFGEIEERGVCAVLSNSDTPETRRLYESFAHEFVRARRAINSNAGGRGAVSELLVVTRGTAVQGQDVVERTRSRAAGGRA
jgi:DNA adenine methylase